MTSPSGDEDIGALLKTLDQHRQYVKNPDSSKTATKGEVRAATSPKDSLKFPFGDEAGEIRFNAEADIIEVCKIVISKLKVLATSFGNKLTTDIDLSFIEKCVDDKEVIISFYGISNVGKSTVVNSILGDVYLPMAGNTETAVSVRIEFIGPKSFSDLFPTSKEVVLRNDGACYHENSPKELCSRLKRVNKDSRKKGAKEAKSCNYELIFSHCLMGVDSSQKVILLDNPGLDEFGSNVVTHSLLVAKKKSSAFVVVATFEDYRRVPFTSLLQELYHQDPDILKDDRLTFVINKMDVSLKRKRNEENFTTKYIIDTFKEYMSDVVFKCSIKDIKDKSIIPLCGSWALYSKKFLKNKSPSDDDVEDIIEFHEELLKTSLKPTPEKCVSTCSENYVKQEAVLLKKHSNINVLEDRLVELTKNAMSLWKRKNVNDLLAYISALKHQVERSIKSCEDHSAELKKKIDRDYVDIKYFEKVYCEVVNNCRRDVTMECGIVKDLKRKYEKDLREKNLVENMVRDLNNTIKAFKDTAKEKMGSGGGYNIKVFVSDLKCALNEWSGRMLIMCNSLDNLKEGTEDYMDVFHDKISDLRRYVSEKYRTTKTSKHRMNLQLKPPILTKNVDLPIQLSMFERVAFFYRSLFFMSLEDYNLPYVTIPSEKAEENSEGTAGNTVGDIWGTGGTRIYTTVKENRFHGINYKVLSAINNSQGEYNVKTKWTADLDSMLNDTKLTFEEQIHSKLPPSGDVVMEVVRCLYKTQLDCLRDFENVEEKSIINVLKTFKEVFEDNEMTKQNLIHLGKCKNYIEEMREKLSAVSLKEFPQESSV